MSGSEGLANLRRAVETLQRFLSTPVEDERDRAGVIQAFEFCFEATSKALQKVGAAEGVQVASPRRALSLACELQLIDDEDEWLQMLTDRDLTVHAYNEAVARDIFERIQQRHAAALAELLRRMEGSASTA